MKNLLYFIAFTFLFQLNSWAQEAINNYKYVVIPHQFEFQKSQDQYQLNSLTKFLFNKYGYDAYLDSEEFPADLGANNCLGLKAVVKDESGMLRTKLVIDLVDCRNNIIATSELGVSKLKKRDKAYNQAIRNAFVTYEYFDYNYEPQKDSASKSAPNIEENDVEIAEPILASEKKTEPVELEVVEEDPIEHTKPKEKEELLYAQPIDNGFQIVDTEPKKVMILLYSGIPDTYIVKGKDAIVYKNAEGWIYAENDGDKLKVKGLNLKF